MKVKDQDYLNNLRHSCAHLLAASVLDLYPAAKLAIGPSIADGFYYDIDFGKEKLSEDSLPRIEKRMRKILPSWQGFKEHLLSADEAKSEYKENPYKEELIDEFSQGDKKVSFYETLGSQSSYFKRGSFWDLCKGGHIASPAKELKNFKLLSLAGAYWRGDEKNPMLTRIYGTVFPTKKELDSYLEMKEEAKKRDHRKIGKELGLFSFSDLVGAGFPLYSPKGAILRRLINDHVESIQSKKGYQQVWTPQVGKAELFKISGHYDKYKDDMFRVVSNYSKEEFFLKPMNCPQHTQIYASRPRSYKELPIRMTDFAMLYRDEKPGEISGLARTRAFSQDDCHIFCMESQVDEEVDLALSMIKEIMAVYGFDYRYRMSTRDPKTPEKYIGDPKQWDRVEKWAEKIMARNKIDHYDAPGEAAFYAPKMDLMATDSLGREWQLSTIQIDYFMPERFKLSYTDRDGQEKRPVMLHRAIIGSPERFLMVLIEHFAGSFPVWLSPVQVKVLPITSREEAYARKVVKELTDRDLRAEVDDRNETLSAKVRDAQNEKIPYMLIVGEKEAKEKTLSLRLRSGKDQGKMKMIDFLNQAKKIIETKSLDLV